MINEIFELMDCFPNSYVNHNGEVILSKKGNVFFNATDCVVKKDIYRKLLHWCSRDIAKGIFYSNPTTNKKFRQALLEHLNSYLHTSFSLDDMYVIYEKLGNGVNPSLTDSFISSNFDMQLLNREVKMK